MSPTAGERMILPSTTPPAARHVAERLAASLGITLVEIPMVRDRPAWTLVSGDRVVHSLPDVFGRTLPPPDHPRVVTVVDRGIGGVETEDTIAYGVPSSTSPDEMTARLRVIWKPLNQQRGIRPALAQPAPFGLAFLAPDGISPPPGLAVTPVSMAGLPDLVIVHHPDVTAWTPYDATTANSEFE